MAKSYDYLVRSGAEFEGFEIVEDNPLDAAGSLGVYMVERTKPP